MFPKEVEVILARHLASYLAMPIFIVDPAGNLVYYNESAELILGRRFDEAGEMDADEWGTIFHPTDAEGNRLSSEVLPLMVTLQERRPAYRKFWIQGLDGVRRCIAVSALPLLGQSHRFLGAMGIFWEVEEE
jgi:PAS domain S-box-containing protein